MGRCGTTGNFDDSRLRGRHGIKKPRLRRRWLLDIAVTPSKIDACIGGMFVGRLGTGDLDDRLNVLRLGRLDVNILGRRGFLVVFLVIVLLFLLRLRCFPPLWLKLDCCCSIIFNVLAVAPPSTILPTAFIPALILERQLAPTMEISVLKASDISMFSSTFRIPGQKPRPAIWPIRCPRISKLSIPGCEAVLPSAMIRKPFVFGMPFAVSFRCAFVQTADINGVHISLRASGVLANHAITCLLASFELIFRCRIIFDFETLVAGYPVWHGSLNWASCGRYRRCRYGRHRESRGDTEKQMLRRRAFSVGCGSLQPPQLAAQPAWISGLGKENKVLNPARDPAHWYVIGRTSRVRPTNHFGPTSFFLAATGSVRLAIHEADRGWNYASHKG